MNAIELLKAQHEEVKELFEKIKKAAEAEGSKKQEATGLVDQLVRKLVGHAVIEEEIFYPAYAKAVGLEDELFEAYEEHGVAEFELQKLRLTKLDDPALAARVDVTKELIEHHVEEEEKEVFKKASKEMSAEELDELGERMKAKFLEVTSGDYVGELVEALRKVLPPLGRTGRTADVGARVRATAKKGSGSKVTPIGSARKGGAKPGVRAFAKSRPNVSISPEVKATARVTRKKATDTKRGKATKTTKGRSASTGAKGKKAVRRAA